MWARLRAPGAKELHVPYTGTNTRCPQPSPPAEGRVCVCVCVRSCVRARTASQPPHALCPRTRLSLRAPGPAFTRRNSRACVAAAAREPRPLPGAQDRNPRAARPSAGLLRILGSLARHPRSRPAARAGGRLERAGGGGAEPAAWKASKRNADHSPLATLPSPRLCATLPNQNPFSSLSSPSFCAFS